MDIELKGFSERQHVCDLLAQSYLHARDPKPVFSPEAIDMIFESYSGHPRLTLMVAQWAVRESKERNNGAASGLRACRALDSKLRNAARTLPR